MEEVIRLDARVRCLDGSCGSLYRVVMHPSTHRITHLVVHMGGMFGAEVVVPIGYMEAADIEEIRLKLSRDELKDLPPFSETDFSLPEAGAPRPPYIAEGGVLWPSHYAPFLTHDIGPGPMRIEHHNVPAGELELREGEPVYCQDGECGRVERVLFDSDTEEATGFVIRQGFLFTRDVSIPLGWVDHVDAEGIHLKGTKDQLKKLEMHFD